MVDRLDSALHFQQEALNLRAERQQVLSSNIANADTPNYKARDFDFGKTLTQAVERGRQSQSMSMTTTSAGHMSGTATATAAGGADLQYRSPTQSSIDGNTVEMDVERVNFADNAVHYEASLTVLGAQIKTMLSAVSS
ncbi:flagellar basal body rod protein FlgB [Glaciimonas sp. PAMC28666]|uniref:flagellar basal body rod protein FlgB n=1 Tax=Glaciimonas sp. PAMC28666 TaxID=2807626 RepID=UPI0019661356|nr:flagellar basal body rod protein FlgB [Glaciimonas sp. PAMC28666]QRX83139.1 flagellar basal body rod protein FlgB [Glaciimonas sp. PAMC28666]